MYEHLTKPLLPPEKFYKRLAAHGMLGLGVIAVSLLWGILGYHGLANLSWVDALLNASMIMGGMGPVDTLTTNPAKIFASFYALYCGLILLISVGIFFAPIVHRILHRLHVKEPRER